jgi:hypothetical protein
MKNLENLITGLENNIPKQGCINEAISKSSVGWHIEHTLLTFNLIIDLLKKSDPDTYKWKFNFWRTVILTTGKIPRGRAPAPKSVRPKDDFTAETLQQHAAVAREKLMVLQNLHPNSYFEHPYFGKLKLRSAIKFLKLHTKHHLEIINDIIGR